MSAVGDVLVAAASSVAKVFLIAMVGFLAVKHPRSNPLIPPSSITVLSRFAFTILNIPLVYSSLGSTLSIDVLGSLWFVPLAGVCVISISFLAATITERIPLFRVVNRDDFDALRVACSFPNILAIPILVFPSLCEYEVVWSSYVTDGMTRSPVEECTNSLNAMTFTYFFAWLFMFFLFGNQILVNAGKRKVAQGKATRSNAEDDIAVNRVEVGEHMEETSCSEDGEVLQQAAANGSSESDSDIDATRAVETRSAKGAAPNASDMTNNAAQKSKSAVSSVLVAVKRAMLNPGTIAMLAGLVTALIAPLQAALFAPGGALRFAGSALESLAAALPSVATMITAASLITGNDRFNEGGGDGTNRGGCGGKCTSFFSLWPFTWLKKEGAGDVIDPSYMEVTTSNEEEQPSRRRSSLANMRRASVRLRRQSLEAIRLPSVRMHIWFNLTRLFITPGIICGILIGLDCGTNLFDAVPHMAKLVVLLNSSVPSAMLVILSLKSEGLSETAAVVAQVFVPSYILSIFTIALWTSIGLILSIPDDSGKYFCER